MEHLAHTILLAAECREQSWDDTKYTKTIEKAAIEAAGHQGAHTRESHLVYILLTVAWNDAQEWARETLHAHLS